MYKIKRVYYYTEETGGIYLHESIGGEPFTKTLTPFPEIPYAIWQ